jgi:hypothetical protein
MHNNPVLQRKLNHATPEENEIQNIAAAGLVVPGC